MTKKQMRMESRFADATANLAFLPRFNIAPKITGKQRRSVNV